MADHPDAAPAAIERIFTAACAYLRVRLTYDLTRQHVRGPAIPDCAEAAAPALIRPAPAVWHCQGVDYLVRITGIAGYSHDGQVLCALRRAPRIVVRRGEHRTRVIERLPHAAEGIADVPRATQGAQALLAGEVVGGAITEHLREKRIPLILMWK